MAHKLVSCSACVLVALFVLSTVNVSRQASLSLRVLSRGERSVLNQTHSNKACEGNTPCGWAVYVPSTRVIDNFMQNTCECEKSKQCVRTDDDVSISAYVYRCREHPAKSWSTHPDATMYWSSTVSARPTITSESLAILWERQRVCKLCNY